MKKIICVTLLITVLGIVTSCNKELKDYDGVEGIYFDAQWGASWGNYDLWAHQLYSPVEFGEMVSSDSTIEVKVGVTGKMQDYDRQFQVVIDKDSTNAVLGEDYSDFIGDGLIKAGETKGIVKVTIHKTERMSQDTVVVFLRLLPNEYFSLPFTSFGKVPGRWDDTRIVYSSNSDPRIHKVVGTDILVKPKGWWGISDGSTGTLGRWSATKYRLIMEVCNVTVADFANQTTMPSVRASVIAEQLAKYLIERMNAKDPVMDEGDIVMWVKGVTWAANLKRKDLNF